MLDWAANWQIDWLPNMTDWLTVTDQQTDWPPELTMMDQVTNELINSLMDQK